MFGGAGGISVDCRVRARAWARSSEASARCLARSSSRSYSRRSVASKTATRITVGDPSSCGLQHRVDQPGSRLPSATDEVERHLAHRALHLQHRRVVGLVVDPAAGGEQVGEGAPPTSASRS